MGSDIKFLVKFIEEENYVDNLINHGELFLRPLGHFAKLEKDSSDEVRGDEREGLLLNSIRIGSNYPIYCMYSIFESDVLPDGLLIKKRAVENFLSKGTGYFAIIDYNNFISSLKVEDFDGYAINTDIVKYGSIDWEFQKSLLISNSQLVAFVKRSDYSYQQEFRLVVQKRLPIIKDIQMTEKYKKIHGKDFPDVIYTYSNYIVKIGSLQNFAKKYSVNDLQDYDEDYFFLKK